LEDLAQLAVEEALRLGASYADIRIELYQRCRIEVSKGRIERLSCGSDAGAGVRALVRGRWGFSSTTDLTREGVKKAAEEAVRSALAMGEPKEPVELAEAKPVKARVVKLGAKRLEDTPLEEKLKITLDSDKAMTSYSPKVKSTTVLYEEAYGRKVFASSEGTLVETVGSRCYLSHTAVARENGRIQSYRTRAAAYGGLEKLLEQKPAEKARKAAERACMLLEAEAPPSGKMTVIADPEHIGVFVHEAVGHACEADAVVAGESCLAGKIGEKIGSDIVTIVDDSTLDWWGSEEYDDEGVKTARRVLIEEGALKSYMLNRESAFKLKMGPNGSARAMSFRHPPIVRMSNTYIQPGDYRFEELLEDVSYGVYVKGSRGGQVDPAVGYFQFNAQEAWLIEKGELKKLLTDVSLSGLILETLKHIDAVGRDMELSVGFCGKAGQMVPVGDGGPHVRIREAVVGGRR